MKAKEIMRKKFPFLRPNDTIKKAVKLMLSTPESAVPVLDKKGNMIGELFQRDFLESFEEFDEEEIRGPSSIRRILARNAKTVKEMMRPIEIEASPEDDIKYIARIMYEKDVVSVPIVNEKGKLLGVVTEADILKTIKK